MVGSGVPVEMARRLGDETGGREDDNAGGQEEVVLPVVSGICLLPGLGRHTVLVHGGAFPVGDGLAATGHHLHAGSLEQYSTTHLKRTGEKESIISR